MKKGMFKIKKLLLLLIIILCINNCTYAIDLNEFSNEIKKYSNDYFPELANDNLINSVENNEETISIKNFFNKIIKGLVDEFKGNIALIFKIIGISILCAVLKNIQSNFEESSVSEVAFYSCYLLIIILVMTSFTNIIEICKNTIDVLSGFMKIIIPIIISLLAVTGRIATIATIQPILLIMISIITTLITNIIIPTIYISTVINIISNISEKASVNKIGELLKKGSIWILEFVLVIFTGVLSLEGTLSANVDSLAYKSSRSIVSNSVPVIGKLLGDTVDSVIGGINITKNAVGLVGIVTIISIILIPLIRTLILMIYFNIASAIVEPIADKRIVKCMSGMADSVKIVFSVMVTTSFLFIIAISLMIKISNS